MCFLFLEISCRVLVYAGLLHHETHPTTGSPTFWAYIDPVVGMWRYPNKSIHHKTDCIDQHYQTNSVGARDPERTLQSADTRRVVVLGDSMVEGHGVAREDRMTDMLERRTGIEHLNFGTSGSFGTIQEWLYYREYASKYDHSDVLLFILPANDFEDNDAAAFGKGVYRPYLRPVGDSYEVYYPVAFEDRDLHHRSDFKVIKHTIENNVYLFNALRWGLHVYKAQRNSSQPLVSVAKTPSYENFTAADLQVMKFALNETATIAGDRKVYLFTVPVGSDISVALQDGYGFTLVDELTQFAATRANVEYIDLLPHFLQYMEKSSSEFRDLSLGCNGHWGRTGNEVVADVVYNYLYAPRANSAIQTGAQ